MKPPANEPTAPMRLPPTEHVCPRWTHTSRTIIAPASTWRWTRARARHGRSSRRSLARSSRFPRSAACITATSEGRRRIAGRSTESPARDLDRPSSISHKPNGLRPARRDDLVARHAPLPQTMKRLQPAPAAVLAKDRQRRRCPLGRSWSARDHAARNRPAHAEAQ
jgi:hypothetical protein